MNHAGLLGQGVRGYEILRMPRFGISSILDESEILETYSG